MSPGRGGLLHEQDRRRDDEREAQRRQEQRRQVLERDADDHEIRAPHPHHGEGQQGVRPGEGCRPGHAAPPAQDASSWRRLGLAGFFAGGFLAAGFFAGAAAALAARAGFLPPPLASRSASRSTASSIVRAAGSAPLGHVGVGRAVLDVGAVAAGQHAHRLAVDRVGAQLLQRRRAAAAAARRRRASRPARSRRG